MEISINAGKGMGFNGNKLTTKWVENENIEKPYSAVHQGVHKGSRRNAEAPFVSRRVLAPDRGEPKEVGTPKGKVQRNSLKYYCSFVYYHYICNLS